MMQALWIKTQTARSSAVLQLRPVSAGGRAGDAVLDAADVAPRTPVPRLPLRPPDDYLRDAMVATLSGEDVAFDFRLQLQTDPHLMPIENNGVRWPERLSPRVSVATLRMPTAALRFAGADGVRAAALLQPVAFVPEHRPLGNQSRARRRMYYELSKLRHE